jgi:hypothetical protein
MNKKVLFIIGVLSLLISGGLSACSSSFTNPPKTFQESDLVGTWQTSYEKNETDTLVIADNGTYQQKYVDQNTKYSFVTNWNSWSLEKNPDGSIYVFLSGGRYYVEGVRIGELNGRGDSCPSNLPACISGSSPRIFYDPYSKENIEMVNELVLNIRYDSRGNMFLHHMWTNSDRGFAIIGGETEFFRRANNP